MGVYKLSEAGSLVDPRVNYTSMLAGNEAYVEPGDYELIESTILGSATGSVTFSSLATYASTYKHLQIRMASRSTHAGAAIITIRLNGDTGNNYAWHSIFGTGSSVNTGAVSSTSGMEVALVPSANEAANVFGGSVIDILDPYSTTKNKTVRTFHGSAVSGATRVILASGAFFSTSSTSQITLSTYASWAAGSRFSLYGLRG